MRELQDPIGYDGPWLLVAVVGLVAVAVYYALVLVLTRPRPARPPQAAEQVDRMARLDEIEREVASGRVSARVGHQQISEVVRAAAAQATGRPTTSMALADLERDGPATLAGLVAELYPPEFGADDAVAEERFAHSLARARELVTGWT